MGMNVSDTLAGTFKLKASTTIAINDAVGIGPDGRGYPIACTDYAAVSNCTYGTAQTSKATGMVIADTQITGAVYTVTYSRQGIAIGDDGSIFYSIYTLSGTKLVKFSAAGVLKGSVTFLNGYNASDIKTVKLPNGNILSIAYASSQIICAVYDQNLQEIVAPISSLLPESLYNSASCFGLCTLSGGGFAIVYQQSADYHFQRFIRFDNSCSVVVSPVTIFTGVGSQTNGSYSLPAELSNGDIGIAHGSGFTSNPGLYAIAVSPAGVVINSTLIQYGQSSYLPSISVMTGYFCVARSDGALVAVAVCDNTGIPVAATSTTSVSTGGTLTTKVLNSGGYFYVVTQKTSAVFYVLKYSVAGVKLTTGTITNQGNSAGVPMDAFINDNLIVMTQYGLGAAGSRNGFSVFDVNSMADLGGTDCGSGNYNNGALAHIVNGGDYTFITVSETTSPSEVQRLFAGKYANTSIAGVAASSAAANDYANLYQGAGTYPVNPLKGSPAVAFDHTTGSNITGNKGTILTNGLVLRGM